MATKSRKTLEFKLFSDRARFGEYYPRAFGVDPCRQHFPSASGTGSWVCTREVGHEGNHVAHNTDGDALAVYAQYPVEQSQDAIDRFHTER